MRPMRCFFRPHPYVYVLRYASWLSKTPHLGWGLRTPAGAMTPEFELGRDFCAMHLPPSFIILCLLVRKLSCWQTSSNTQTNRRRRKHPTFFATLRRWVINLVLFSAVIDVTSPVRCGMLRVPSYCPTPAVRYCRCSSVLASCARYHSTAYNTDTVILTIVRDHLQCYSWLCDSVT